LLSPSAAAPPAATNREALAPCYASHRRGAAGRARGVGRRAGDLDELGARFRHEPLEGLTASKRRSAGGGADASAILGDAMESSPPNSTDIAGAVIGCTSQASSEHFADTDTL